jgi:hypothetical protein
VRAGATLLAFDSGLASLLEEAGASVVWTENRGTVYKAAVTQWAGHCL